MKTSALLSLALLILLGCQPPETDGQRLPKVQQEKLLLNVPSPQWQDQIIYFLMTDRFADGDPKNNDIGAGEYDPTKESHYSGGDLQGLINNLDYIQNLGATAVWTTPIVANQWWSSQGNYGGYHGYWATDFSNVDAHLGSNKTYKQLSDNLHRRGMYLIQDIVVNHTGNFFNYHSDNGGYDKSNTAQNFFLMAAPDALQPAPIQAPFHQINRNNPEHVAANIYNWTPSITDFNDVYQQYTYQLSTLADINTKNPVVIERFKQIYGDWITTFGVDAFRIDTVRYVEHDFFHQFMHDDDGIHAVAKSTGRDNFLAFGEVFDTSAPYQNDAEHRVASYLGSKQKPELNSLISFPLHHELKTVFAQGAPTDHLAYRIEQHMQIYEDPYVIPTFIDNHDMARFLASGDQEGFKQALATILTMPGIPTIYQGSAQAMTESRQAMFKGGYLADKDYFDQETGLYRFIAKLAKLRTGDKLFTRGSLQIIASNKNGPGLLAYTRKYQGRTVLIMFNTARHEILVNKTKIASQTASLSPLFGDLSGITLDASGSLTTLLPGRSIVIAELKNKDTHIAPALKEIVINADSNNETKTRDFTITGQSDFPNSQITLVKNSRMDTGQLITTDQDGNWHYTYRVKNLGTESVTIAAYHANSGVTSDEITFLTSVETPQYTFSFTDPHNDDKGLTGQLSAPTHNQSIGQQDIVGIRAEVGGEILTLNITMKQLTNQWLPTNGFDNVAFSLFFDIADQKGALMLPMINASMPNKWNWDLGHVIYGWGNTTFSNKNANAHHQGEKFGIAPTVSVSDKTNTIQFRYRSSDFGVNSWLNSHIYITTWDITGEGAYRELTPKGGPWTFGGGQHNDAKILDVAELTLKAH